MSRFTSTIAESSNECNVGVLEITNKACTRPNIWVIALIPIDAERFVSYISGACIAWLTKSFDPQYEGGSPKTHQGQCCACHQRSPLSWISLYGRESRDLCILPVYSGYNGIGSNPSCFSNTELVHSQTPPISPCPESRLPFWVTGVGWKCLKPTLQPSRLVKSSIGSSPDSVLELLLREGCDGGDSSTPSLDRWLPTG